MEVRRWPPRRRQQKRVSSPGAARPLAPDVRRRRRSQHNITTDEQRLSQATRIRRQNGWVSAVRTISILAVVLNFQRRRQLGNRAAVGESLTVLLGKSAAKSNGVHRAQPPPPPPPSLWVARCASGLTCVALQLALIQTCGQTSEGTEQASTSVGQVHATRAAGVSQVP